MEIATLGATLIFAPGAITTTEPARMFTSAEIVLPSVHVSVGAAGSTHVSTPPELPLEPLVPLVPPDVPPLAPLVPPLVPPDVPLVPLVPPEVAPLEPLVPPEVAPLLLEAAPAPTPSLLDEQATRARVTAPTASRTRLVIGRSRSGRPRRPARVRVRVARHARLRVRDVDDADGGRRALLLDEGVVHVDR